MLIKSCQQQQHNKTLFYIYSCFSFSHFIILLIFFFFLLFIAVRFFAHLFHVHIGHTSVRHEHGCGSSDLLLVEHLLFCALTTCVTSHFQPKACAYHAVQRHVISRHYSGGSASLRCRRKEKSEEQGDCSLFDGAAV